MSACEFSRMVDIRAIVEKPVTLTADEVERTALARRFDLVSIDMLTAEISLAVESGAIEVNGRLHACIIQTCAVSSEPLSAIIEEAVSIRFVPERAITEEEIELEEGELDEIAYAGTSFDLGEAIAQSLALAIDPYAVGPAAERARQEAGLTTPEAVGPFAALAALKKA